MDEYPAFSLDHNTPLLVVLGLPPNVSKQDGLEPDLREEAIQLQSEAPLLDFDQAAALLRYLEDKDASDLPWNGRDAARKYNFRVKSVGRSYMLPSRRAKLPEDLEAPPTPPTLHSPFSPLSPACRLYPDGLIDARWLQKHQDLIPSTLLCCYSLTADPTMATLEDNKIKTDINSIKNTLVQSGRRSRLAVVLLRDEDTAAPGEGIQERVDSIRRGCGMDTRSFFSIPPHGSQEELERIVDNALVTLYGPAIEYYRELGRHAKKKKGRGAAPQPTVPPTSGTSQTLPLAGWNVRYDFKSAIFAEFRQEMDTALKSFDQAYESLLSGEVFDMIPSWSPRWNEARLLADIIAIRILRCLLWSGHDSSAVRWWQSHRDRTCDLVDRRGRGTNNYGWKAWEARWAIVMANLIDRAGLPEFHLTDTLFLQPEKSLQGERMLPWELMHHPGYWYFSAARHMQGRRAYAQAMPEDDRRSPSFSPASRAASKAYTHDTYMCPEPHEEYPLGLPGVNHSQLIIDCLMSAKQEFQRRKQTRLCAEISLECAKELAVLKDWTGVVELLRPLWEDVTFRSDEWLDITEDLGWTLRAAAANIGRLDLVVAVDWELMNRKFTRRTNWHYDLTKAGDGASAKSKPTVHLSDEIASSFLDCSFSFLKDQGKAGETCQVQLAIKSNAFSDAAPVVLDSLQIEFEGSLKTVELKHDPDHGAEKGRNATLSTVTLQETAGDAPDPGQTEETEARAWLAGKGNLTLTPGQTTVFEMSIPLREPGQAHASSLKMALDCDVFSLSYVSQFREGYAAPPWFLPTKTTRNIPRAHPHTIRVLPRPPKMEIKLLNPVKQYYTNERVELRFEILNAEDADANPKLDATLSGEEPLTAFRLSVEDGDSVSATVDDEESRISSTVLDAIKSSASSRVTLVMDPIERSVGFDLTLKVSYNLVTDPATPIIQSVVFPLNFISPFEANYDLVPRPHPDPWPSVFDYEGLQDLSDDQAVVPPRGLSQMWCLVSRYASFALEDLRISGLDIKVASSQDVRCHTAARTAIPQDGLQISPKSIEEAQFDVVAQRMSLDKRSQSTLDVSFIIKWSRLGSSAVNTTLLPVPRLNIFGTEPRVLASVSYSKDDEPGLVFLDITIENASNHFLTFGLAMEPSDDFAFSGAKQTTLHLLPVSRRSVTYRLMPLVRGAWVRPALVVRDKYFQKVLRIIPTEGMKLDKGGFLVWFPPPEDQDE